MATPGAVCLTDFCSGIAARADTNYQVRKSCRIV